MIDWSSATAESLETASAPYLGQWHRLVSTTNWEKGRIISEWRAALAAATAPAGEYADEAWARRVGGVSGQHVGRLRRVAERFNSTRSQFHGLYWSHFQAALDWNDAEMWLEGAVQSRWSVAEMRRQRAETLGGAVEVNSADDALAEDSQAEEFAPGICDPDSATADSASAESASGSNNPPWDDSENRYGDNDSAHSGERREHGERTTADRPADDTDEPSAAADAQAPFRPFPQLAELPDDLAEAFESFKLAIVRHRLAGWEAIARGEVLTALDWLRQLVLNGDAN